MANSWQLITVTHLTKRDLDIALQLFTRVEFRFVGTCDRSGSGWPPNLLAGEPSSKDLSSRAFLTACQSP